MRVWGKHEGAGPGLSQPATTEVTRIWFNELNVGTGNRVAQQLVDSKTGETVDRDRIVKGYEFERGSYVTITDDELKDLQIESSKVIGTSPANGARGRCWDWASR